MWQRFTERARRVILLGQEEAGRMGAGHVGTEHILLGLIREDEGVGAQIMQKLGVSLSGVRQEIEAESQLGNLPPDTEPKLTPEAKRVLELAADEARRMRHNYIGTEHLLLALLREKDGLAATVLRRLGINLEKARAQVMEYLRPDAPGANQIPPLDDSNASQEDSTWKRLSRNARQIIVFAQEESLRMSSGCVGSEHLLLGLTRQSEGIAAQIFQSLGVSLDQIRQGVESELHSQSEISSAGAELPSQAREALELAADEANRTGGRYIGGEHLLLGLLRQKEGIGALILARIGLDLETTRQKVADYLGQSAYIAPLSSSQANPANRAETSVSSATPSGARPHFTDRVRIVVLIAQDEAMKLGSDSIGTEHILLSLLAQEEGVATHVLQKLGASSDTLREQLRAELERKRDLSSKTPALSPVAKRILVLAGEEAQWMRDAHIGTGHLLLALLRESEELSLSASVLSQSGLTRDNALQALNQYLESEGAGSLAGE